MLLLKIPIKLFKLHLKSIVNVEQIHMISATKFSKGGVAVFLIIVISQKKDKSGRIVRNPFIKIILRENFRR